MIAIIIGIAIVVGLPILILRVSRFLDTFEAILLGGFLPGLLLLFIVPLFLIPITGGLGEGYGHVCQVGYLTNFGERGIIWKTWEGELQKGVGEQAAIEKPFKFSSTDPDVIAVLKPFLGSKQRIQIECKQWLIMPSWKGSSGNKVVSVVDVKEERRSGK
jgi:hypothetical protein